MLPGAATVTTMGTEWVSESDNPTAVTGELFRLSTGASGRRRSCAGAGSKSQLPHCVIPCCYGYCEYGLKLRLRLLLISG